VSLISVLCLVIISSRGSALLLLFSKLLLLREKVNIPSMFRTYGSFFSL
jgi:hypothetical protein